MEGTFNVDVVKLVPIGGNPVDEASVKLVLIGGNPVDEDVDGLMEGTLDVDADDVGDVLIGRNFSLVPSC
jgi:hypothetical protein